jgi:HSP20 family protein
MLMRTDPFRELDRLTQQFFGVHGTQSRPAVMPMDAFRDGEQFVVRFDLPGVSPDSIDLDVERNVLTVKAERTSDGTELQVAERPKGVFSRQLFLGDTLDTDRVPCGSGSSEPHGGHPAGRTAVEAVATVGGHGIRPGRDHSPGPEGAVEGDQASMAWAPAPAVTAILRAFAWAATGMRRVSTPWS